MDEFKQSFNEELDYLNKTLELIRAEIDKESSALKSRRKKLIESRKDMYENTAYSTNDFDKLSEVTQHLIEINNQSAIYGNTVKRLDRLGKMLNSPYFGRFDFLEDAFDYPEKIYVGLHNLMNSKTGEILVYDWRAPISAIFYQFELGRAFYNAPVGKIEGEVRLKRQYKIKNSELKTFFDCSTRINDEILQDVLSRNSSPKMRNIVETIQKEQDRIIRDTENELLIVQGVAGSGKTSIALHRIAFLLYNGLESNIGTNNVIIISPNAVFSKYISSVLPELGEDNVEQTTVDEIISKLIGDRVRAESRNRQLEALISGRNSKDTDIRRKSVEFKGSKGFVKILDELLKHFERRMLHFEDIYFDGKIIMTRQQLKSAFLNNKIGMPAKRRLQRIESMIMEKLNPLQKKRLEKIQNSVLKSGGHEFEVKSFSRLLSIKEAKALKEMLDRFMKIDYLFLYKALFNDSQLFYRLAKGIDLPQNIEKIIRTTRKELDRPWLNYEDSAPLIYLKLKLEGLNDMFEDIKQVVIDEAQDYFPLQYEVFKLLFKDARFTVLGDINQAVEKDVEKSLYEQVIDIFSKKYSSMLFLNKTYRASFEINSFTQRILNKEQGLVPFERYEAEPMVLEMGSVNQMEECILKNISEFIEQGFESIAVITKTADEAREVYRRMKGKTEIRLFDETEGEINKGALIIPGYMAKGLEFDVVMVYGTDGISYHTENDRKLLYIACTRALHRLVLYYTGEKSLLV